LVNESARTRGLVRVRKRKSAWPLASEIKATGWSTEADELGGWYTSGCQAIQLPEITTKRFKMVLSYKQSFK